MAAIKPVLGDLAVSHELAAVRTIEVTPGSSLEFVRRPTVTDPGIGTVFDLVVATTEATGHAGQLRFGTVSSSRVRTIDEAARSGSAHRERGLRTLPLTAGSCVLLRDGIGVSTHKNNSGSTTSFKVVTLVPIGAELTVFRRVAPRKLERSACLDRTALERFLAEGLLPEAPWVPVPDTPRISMRGSVVPFVVASADRALTTVEAARAVLSDPRGALRQRGRVREGAPSFFRAYLRAARVGREQVSSSGAHGARTSARLAEAVLVASGSIAADATRTACDQCAPARVSASQRTSVAEEFSGVLQQREIPPAAYLFGLQDSHEAPGDRRLVLFHNRLWIERSVEVAPTAAAVVRELPDVIGAALVQVREPCALTADPHAIMGTDTVLYGLSEGTETAQVFSDQSTLAQHVVRPGIYLLLHVVAIKHGPGRWLAVVATHLRPLRPSARWLEHRDTAWEGRGPSLEEPPEGVLVEHYADFGNTRDQRRRSLRQRLVSAIDKAAIPITMGLVRANSWAVGRHLNGRPAVWDPAEFWWTSRIEDVWSGIRAEVTELMESGQWVPTVREVAGVEAEADRPAVGSTQEWRNYILYHRGHWMDWNCRQCPTTADAVRQIPGLNFAFLSILEPGGHIARHRGPNRGALRYHLGVMIPDPPESCTIEINGVERHWHENEALMFDLSSEHEVWNCSGEARVLLMCEVNAPLPVGLRHLNRFTQALYSTIPPFRRMKAHLVAVELPERRQVTGA